MSAPTTDELARRISEVEARALKTWGSVRTLGVTLLADVAALRADLSAVCAERDELAALLDEAEAREGP